MANISFDTPTFPIKGLTASYAVSASWTQQAATAAYCMGTDGEAVVDRTEFNNLKSQFERVSSSVESKSGSWDKTSRASAGSTSAPVYVSGGMPYTVSKIAGIPITASTLRVTGTTTFAGGIEGDIVGNVNGDVTGSRVSASIQVYAPTISGSNGNFTAVTASAGFKGNLTGNASTATKLVNATSGSASVPVYISGGVPKAITTLEVESVTSSFRGNLAGNASTSTKLVNSTSGSAALPVYISGGVPKTITTLEVASVTASVKGDVVGNVTGNVTGSRVSASVQVYAPTLTGTNGAFTSISTTNLTASNIQGTLVGTASAATSASYVPFTRFVQTKNIITASVGGTTRYATVESTSFAATAACVEGTASYAVEASKVTHTLKLTGSVNATYNGASDVVVSIPDPLDVISGSTSSIAATASYALYSREAGNADTLDGTHKAGLFTQYIVSGSNIARGEANNFHIITVGDVLKSASLKHTHAVELSSAGKNLTVNVAGISSSVVPNYASVAGYATSSANAENADKISGVEASTYATVLTGSQAAWSLASGKIVPVSSSLNDYKVPGNYYQGATAVAKTILDGPVATGSMSAFTLKVEYSTGTGYPRQILRFYDKGHHQTWTRMSSTKEGSDDWGDWTVSTDAVTFGGKAASQYASASHTHGYATPAQVTASIDSLVSVSGSTWSANTKVTSVGNHYTPAQSTGKSVTTGQAVFGLGLDAAGHVTSVTGSDTVTSASFAVAVQVTEHSANNTKYNIVWENGSQKLYKTAAKLNYYPSSSVLYNAGEIRGVQVTHGRVVGAKSGTVTLLPGQTTYINTPTAAITLTTGSVASGQEGIYHCIINMGTLYAVTIPGTLVEGSALIDKANCKYEISICEGITIVLRT